MKSKLKQIPGITKQAAICFPVSAAEHTCRGEPSWHQPTPPAGRFLLESTDGRVRRILILRNNGKRLPFCRGWSDSPSSPNSKVLCFPSGFLVFIFIFYFSKMFAQGLEAQGLWWVLRIRALQPPRERPQLLGETLRRFSPQGLCWQKWWEWRKE